MSNEKIENFTDLKVWQEGHTFVIEIYRITRNLPKEEIYGLVSQVRRAAISITANIAEGFGRYHFKDRIRFYYNARGSIDECQNHIIVSKDLGYISKEEADLLFLKADKIRRILNGLIRSTEAQI